MIRVDKPTNKAVSQIKACRDYFQSGITTEDKHNALEGFRMGIVSLNNSLNSEPNKSNSNK